VTKTSSFLLVTKAVDEKSANAAVSYLALTCGAISITRKHRFVIVEFRRETRNLTRSLIKSIRNVRAVALRVERIEPDYLVSLSEIADRLNLSRAAISYYRAGKRGRNFPMPVARICTPNPLWDWVDVMRWRYRAQGADLQQIVHAKVLREANKIIQSSRTESAILARVLFPELH
jgi:hypothetical protein